MSDLLIHVSRRAMASEFEVRFPADRYPNGMDLALDALDLVESLEHRLSYFKPDSEIGRINRLASEGPVEVESDLFELIRLALQLSGETGGAYDITSAPLWEAWGFARRSGEIPSDAQLAEARSNVGAHLVELDPASRTIRFHKPGVRINLGSIGKGYALDLCAERLRASGMNDFLVYGGLSSVLAQGSPAAATQAWEIGLPHPQQPKQRLGCIRLSGRALATSGAQFQSFRHQGQRYGHILDPRSGRPAEGLLSTTVVAPTAALADALSTAFYVMGDDSSLEYCKKHQEIGAIFVLPEPHGRGATIRSTGFDDGSLALSMPSQ